MITANLAGASSSHFRSERHNYSHSRLNLNDDNSDSASRKDENTGDNNRRSWVRAPDPEKIQERVIERCSDYKTCLYMTCVGVILVGAVVLIVLLVTGVISTDSR